MIAIKKVDSEDKFRKDMYKSKRKSLAEIWKGDYYKEIGDIARFAPSACNSQPWMVESKEDELRVHRYHNKDKRGIMPKDAVKYYNQIDIGIFLCFVELCLSNKSIKYERELFEEKDHEAEYNLTAVYKILV